jgi:RNA polymerase-binding transcription factor DksA
VDAVRGAVRLSVFPGAVQNLRALKRACDELADGTVLAFAESLAMRQTDVHRRLRRVDRPRLAAVQEPLDRLLEPKCLKTEIRPRARNARLRLRSVRLDHVPNRNDNAVLFPLHGHRRARSDRESNVWWARPTPHEKSPLMYKKKELDEFRSILLSLRARLQGDVDQLTDGALDKGVGGGDSKSPTHIAELGTEAYEQEFALSLVENEREVLQEITAALKRVDDGTFGLCEGCVGEGRPPSKSMIPKARLRAIPYARFCVNCARKREELSL